MFSLSKGFMGATAVTLIAGVLAILPELGAADTPVGDSESGKKIANDRKLGNCVACHMMPGSQSPGAIGPPLIEIQSRYPDLEKLRSQLWDATEANPISSMPPFGKHGILTEQQFNDVLAYIWSI